MKAISLRNLSNLRWKRKRKRGGVQTRKRVCAAAAAAVRFAGSGWERSERRPPIFAISAAKVRSRSAAREFSFTQCLPRFAASATAVGLGTEQGTEKIAIRFFD